MPKRQQNTSNYTIDEYEYFSNVEDIDPIPSTIRAYFPKFMPQVTPGTWRKPMPINSGLLVNARECSVVLPTTVTEQGYYTLEHYSNERPNFTSKATLKGGRFVVLKGNTFMAEVLYNDPTDIKFVGKI